jgi:hypothetical protein
MVTCHHPYLLPEMARKHHTAEFYNALIKHLNLTLLTPSSIKENTAGIPKQTAISYEMHMHRTATMHVFFISLTVLSQMETIKRLERYLQYINSNLHLETSSKHNTSIIKQEIKFYRNLIQ